MKKIFLPSVLILGIFACSKTQNKNHQFEDINYAKAESFLDKNNDSSFFYFNKVATTSKDSLLIGRAYNEMAIIQADAGDYFGSQETLLTSMKFLDDKKTKNFSCIASNYNELGLSSFHLKNYENALKFYDLANKFSRNKDLKLMILNNKASVFRDKKEYQSAIEIYNSIITKNISSKIEYARTLTNISKARWLQDPNYNAIPYFLIALDIRKKENSLWGQNSSYAHLADFYMKKQPDSALFYANEMYFIAKKLKSPNDQLEALQKLIKLSPLKEVKHFFETYTNLDDSVQNARSAAKNQFALIRYETEKNKADFLKAKADNTEKEKNILIKNIGIGILIVFLTIGYFWYRRRQKILKQEKEIEVKNTELKYVKKVHDRVANRIYQVIDEIDNRPEMQKDEVAEKLDIIYNISRDLSYESIDTKYTEDFAKELTAMFSSYQSAKVLIEINGNEEKLWSGTNDTVKSEVFIILQELMTNMSKHSEANHVQLNFLRDKERITILYSDNGKGIQNFSPGNGLKNTETRIKNISGVITFDTKPNEGLTIKFSFPI